MKLYNDHNAAIHIPEIESPLSAAFKEVWKYIENKGINPREAELFCINILQEKASMRAELARDNAMDRESNHG